ncbi:MAG: OmpA family protein [Bacteroidales bacterium]|nr:OmpA family protein [Bacteroidales bacterium]
MKKKIIIQTLGVVMIAGSSMAQTTPTDVFPVPEGAKAVSANISGNGQHAIVGFEKDGATRYLSFSKSGGSFANPTENNPLNNIIDKKSVTPLEPSLSVDGSKIYFAADNGSGNTDIYVIEKRNGKWSDMTALGDSINTAAQERYPAIAPDDNTIYFTRIKSAEKGVEIPDPRCGTIYMSTHKADGSWSRAKDVPEPVSLGCDAAPYVGPDSKTIYFASVRKEGRKDFDIYYTFRPDAKTWVIPIPIDTLNGEYHDFAPVYDYDTKQFYYNHSTKKTSAFVNRSLTPNFVHQPITRYMGKTYDQYTNKPLGTEIQVKDAFSSLVLAQFRSDDITGEFDYFLNGRTPVFIDYSHPGYSHNIVETTPDQRENKQDYPFFDSLSLQLNVFDSDIFEALESDIHVYSNGKDTTIKTTEIATGRYKMTLPIGNNYDFHITKDLYLDYDFNLDLSQVVLFESVEKDAELISSKTLLRVVVKGLEAGETADVSIVDISTISKYTTSKTTDNAGNAEFWLRKGDLYQVNIAKKGYTLYNQTTALGAKDLAIEKLNRMRRSNAMKNADINMDPNLAFGDDYSDISITSDETINLDGSVTIVAEIKKMKEGVKMELHNINFETNSSALNASSYDELDKLVENLKMNAEISIELSAHTDDIGSDAYNFKLSDQRAASVAEYLITKGISKKRIISKGYGKTMPLVPNNSDENRAKNRRVELKVISTNNQ